MGLEMGGRQVRATLPCLSVAARTIKVKIVVDAGGQKAARTVGTWTVTRVREDGLLNCLLWMGLLAVVQSLRGVVVTLDGDGRIR